MSGEIVDEFEINCSCSPLEFIYSRVFHQSFFLNLEKGIKI